jgi:MFS family permease
MIESFHIPQNEVAKWAGIISAVFSMSQCLTGIALGRASDSFGRKPVILLGLFTTMNACLVFGFSRSLPWAITTRVIAGAASGTVGIIRTTVAEMVPEKVLQPKAFSIMPLVWTIGSIFGPILGGALAKPASRYPNLLGGVTFFKEFPFALPNLVACLFFLVGLSTGVLFLKASSNHPAYYPALNLGV